MLVVIACLALATGCCLRLSEKWPIKKFLDPVTDEVPNVETNAP